MQLWIFICIWFVWFLWSLLEVWGFITIMQNPRLQYSTSGARWTMLWFVATIFWIGYNISRWL